MDCSTRATAVARHGFDCCFSLSSSRSLSLFPLSFFSLLCVASRHTKTAVTSPPVDRWFATRSGRAARRRAAAQTRVRIRSFSLRVPHAYSVPVLRPPTVHRPAFAYYTDAAVTRSHHLPHGPDRAHRISRARNRRASRKTITSHANASINVHARYKLRVRVRRK